MKRYIKYGLIILTVFAVIGFVFYIIKKPKESVVKNIASDVTYCFTIDKQEFFREKSVFQDFQKDSFFHKIKAKIPAQALEIFNVAGMNTLGDLAIFGETNTEINLAWIGDNESGLNDIIKKNKWPEKKFKTFNQIKISDTLYLNYKWPVLVLRTTLVNENFDFFNPSVKKLTVKELQHSKTEGCLIYGFIIPDRNTIISYPFIPMYGRAFVGCKNDDKKIEVFYIQRRVKLKGKLGVPVKKPSGYAFLSWPTDSQPSPKINQIPSVVMKNMDELVTKPVTHLYAEVLDTTSTYQEVVQYYLDAEFRLTQKIIKHSKPHPGIRLELIKKTGDNASFSKPTNMGLDIFKLVFTETGKSYIIASENKPPLPSAQNLPDYYIYANLDILKTDPFWNSFTKTTIKTLQLHAEPYGKGSIFVLTLER